MVNIHRIILTLLSDVMWREATIWLAGLHAIWRDSATFTQMAGGTGASRLSDRAQPCE